MARPHLVLVLLTLGASATAIPANEKKSTEARWPQFRGPDGLGVAAQGMKLPTQFGPDKNLLWKTPLPIGHSSPCVWGDRIFLTCFDAKAKKLETICLDRRDGQILWRKSAPTDKFERVHEISNVATATPATDGEHVYVYFGSYGLLCYDLSGAEKWKKQLPEPGIRFGSGSSPIVAGDLLLLNIGEKGRLMLLAVNRRTGKMVWKKEPAPAPFSFGPTGSWTTPVHYRNNGSNEVLLVRPGRLEAFSLPDGAERWRVTGLPPVSYSTPIIADDLVFLTFADAIGDPQNVVEIPTFEEFAKKYDKNKDGKISKDEIPADFTLVTRDREDKVGNFINLRDMLGRFDKNKDGALDKEEWEALRTFSRDFAKNVKIGVAAVRLGGKGDVTKTHMVWQESKGVPEVPSPLYYHGRLYLVKERAIVSCLDPKTGKTFYRERLGARGQVYASPVAGDGKIFAATDTGWLVVVKAGDKYEVLAKNHLGEPIMATPALVDNKIYVRTEKHLFAFGE